jgi:hypothetical protein
MIKAILLIMDPGATWERIILARRSLGQILATYLLPMLLIVAFVEGFGLAYWGKKQPMFGIVRNFPVGEVVVFEILQLLLTLVIVFICTRLVEMIGETFHGRHTYTQAFTMVAYGLSPMFLLRLLDVFPRINPWRLGSSASCSAASPLSRRAARHAARPATRLRLIFHKRPAADDGDGLGAVHHRMVFAAGTFLPVENFISNLASRLPF